MASLLMRKISILLPLLLLAVSCSADEKPLTLSEPTTSTTSTPPTTSTTTTPPTTSTTSTPPTTSTSKVAQPESTTTVVELPMPQELDFFATTTDGDRIAGSELWLATNAYETKDEASDIKNEFDEDIVFWFWAPN